MSYHWLFGGTLFGFVASAAIVSIVSIPSIARQQKSRPFFERLTRGVRIYLATPRLRGLLALNLAAAAAGAFIIVNTVVIVLSVYGRSQTDLAYALMAFGGGSMITALLLPRLLEFVCDRTLMLTAGFALTILTIGHALYTLAIGLPVWEVFLSAWAASGMLYAAILTPSGRLLRNSAHAEDRPSIFSAQFALSHACWLLTYPIAGWAGQAFGLSVTMIILGVIALIGSVAAFIIWPFAETAELVHDHSDLPPDHPHLREYQADGKRHQHPFVIDDEHRAWPTHG
jgi:predicted MFS family arabinose efflux permease